VERNLALEVARVTEAAALSSARWMGRGNEVLAEQTALDSMRRAFDVVDFLGTVVIGRGERGETPTLYVGEQVGSGKGPELDVATEPLEGPEHNEHVRTLAFYLRESLLLGSRPRRELPLCGARGPLQCGERVRVFGHAEDLQRAAHQSQSRFLNAM